MKKRQLALILACLSAAAFAGEAAAKAADTAKPNVLLIAIDDLNDWIGCMGGHPQAKTPNIDRLAARGVLFNNAHCQSPVCNPSRASMMTSLYPATTGIYFLNPDLCQISACKEEHAHAAALCAREGYHVTGAGKIFHGNQNQRYLPNWAGSFGGFGPSRKEAHFFSRGAPVGLGRVSGADEQMPDHKIAAWAVEQLKKKQDKPRFLAVGFYRPHVPQYAPQKVV